MEVAQTSGKGPSSFSPHRFAGSASPPVVSAPLITSGLQRHSAPLPQRWGGMTKRGCGWPGRTPNFQKKSHYPLPLTGPPPSPPPLSRTRRARRRRRRCLQEQEGREWGCGGGHTHIWGWGASAPPLRLAVQAPPWVRPRRCRPLPPLLAARPARPDPQANYTTAATPALFLPSEGVRGMGGSGEWGTLSPEGGVSIGHCVPR